MLKQNQQFKYPTVKADSTAAALIFLHKSKSIHQIEIKLNL